MESMGHWKDMEHLKCDKAKAYRFLEDNDIRLCFDSDKLKLLKLLFTSTRAHPLTPAERLERCVYRRQKDAVQAVWSEGLLTFSREKK